MTAADSVNNDGMGHRRGSRLGTLVLNSAKWIHRRVDNLTFNRDGSTHRRTSFDLTVPAALSVPRSAGHVLVPLALVEKQGAKTGFYAEDPNGCEAPFLDGEEGARLSVEMVHALAGELLDSGEQAPVGMLERIVRLPGDVPREEKEAVLGEWDTWRHALVAGRNDGGDERSERIRQLDGLMRELADNMLLFVEIDDSHVGARCVVKVAFDTATEISSFPGRFRSIRFCLPGLGFAQSQHVEVEVPFGLTVRELALAEMIDGALVTSVREARDGGRSGAHVHFSPSAQTAHGVITIGVGAMRGGRFAIALLAAAGGIALTGLSLAERAHLTHLLVAPLPVPSSALVLVFGALAAFLLWDACSSTHRLIATVQAPLRWIEGICRWVYMAACAVVAVPAPAVALDVVLDLMAAGSFLALLAFVTYAGSGFGLPGAFRPAQRPIRTSTL